MKRLKRILKWIAICTGASVACLLLLNAYFVWLTGTRLERKLVALRQAGDPVQLADLAREPIPPEHNADVFLRRAAADLEAIQKDLGAWYPKTACPTGPVTPAEQDRLEKLFAAYPGLMTLLEQAASCPDSDPQIDGTLSSSRIIDTNMKHSTDHRQIYRVLRGRSALLLAKGQNDDALAAEVLTLRLARQWRREPFIIGYLVTAVCEQAAMDGIKQVLQAGPVSPDARQALDAELALHDSMEGYSWALRSERAFSLSSLREMPFTGFWLTRGFASDEMFRLIRLFDQYLELGSRPFAEAVSQKNLAARHGGVPNPYSPLTTLLEPGLAAVREPAERTRAMARSLRVWNALQVQAPRDGDHIPNLTELGLPEKTTIDPFSGEPLHVTWQPQGWLVYSVGSNLRDDGGILDGKTDIGAGPKSPADSGK